MTMRWLMVPAAVLALAGCAAEAKGTAAERVTAAPSPTPVVDQSRYACEQLAATTYDARASFDSARMVPLAMSAAAGDEPDVAEAAVEVVAVFKVYGDPAPGEESLEVFGAVSQWRLACATAFPDILIPTPTAS